MKPRNLIADRLRCLHAAGAAAWLACVALNPRARERALEIANDRRAAAEFLKLIS